MDKLSDDFLPHVFFFFTFKCSLLLPSRLFNLPWSVVKYCIRGNFRGGFIFENFASQTLRKFPFQYMSIYSNENIRKIEN